MKKSPAAAGLIVVFVTIVGWVGCEAMSRVADQTAQMLIDARDERIATGRGMEAALVEEDSIDVLVAMTNNAAAPNPTPKTGADQTATLVSATLGQSGSQPAGAALGQAAGNPWGTATRSTADLRQFITVASFNIEAFGPRKLGDRSVLDYLVDIVRKFDVVAIESLRDPDQTALPYFVNALNAQGGRYRYLVSPLQGAAGREEQIAIVFNSDLVVPTGMEFVARDLQQRMQVNPYVVAFQCRRLDSRAPFTFTLVAVDVNPQAIALELEAIADILPMIRRTTTEDDLILLGTFQTSPDRFGRLGQAPNAAAILGPTVPTNTAKTACWDNLGFDRLATAEFTQQYGVFDVAANYRLTAEQAAVISDHLPIWATFSIFESSSNLALQSPGLAR